MAGTGSSGLVGRAKLGLSVSALVSWGHQNKVPQARWLKQQKFVSSQSWRLDVQDQGMGRTGFSQGLLSPWLADGCLLPRPHRVTPVFLS